MNDSFLEDLELVQVESKRETSKPQAGAERNITTRRRSQQSPLPVVHRHERDAQPPVAAALAPENDDVKVSRERRDRVVIGDGKKNHTRRSKSGSGETVASGTSAGRDGVKVARLKPTGNKLEAEQRPRSTGGENSRSWESSAKENSRPSESSRESVPSRDARETGSGDATRRKRDEKFEVAVLNSVKEIVGTYTRNESTKILRAMQEIYINSQANLVKLMLRNDEESISRDESERVKSLLEENAGLRNELRGALEESQAVKRENILLQTRCEQLAECGRSRTSKVPTRPAGFASSGRNSLVMRARQGKPTDLCRNSE